MKTLGEKDRKIRILLVFSWYFTYNDFIKMMDGCPSILFTSIMMRGKFDSESKKEEEKWQKEKRQRRLI